MSAARTLRPRPAFWGLLLLIGFGIVACDRQPPVDPDAMNAELGKRANKFYRLVSDNKMDDAAAYVSERLRQNPEGPAGVPLLADRMNREYAQVIPTGTELDWRNRVAVISVARHRPQGKMPLTTTLAQQSKERHRWIVEDGTWFFDGPAAR